MKVLQLILNLWGIRIYLNPLWIPWPSQVPSVGAKVTKKISETSNGRSFPAIEKKKKLLECPWISVERLIWPKTTSKDSGTCTIDRFQKWRDETTRLLGWFNLWRGSSNTLIQNNNLPLHFQNVYFKEGPTENYPKTATFQVLCYIFHIFF